MIPNPECGAPPLPVVTYRVRARCWVLEVTYLYAEDPDVIRIPRGFVFDLASVPRLVWPLIAPFELSISAPLVHDFLYHHAGVPPLAESRRNYSRLDADRLFRRMMRRERVPGWRWRPAYAAVRLFGGFVWRRHWRTRAGDPS
jgi:hypothetical protein